MRRPSKKAINNLRIALGMSGLVSINDPVAELILVTLTEMERLGDKYSLKDAAKVNLFIRKHYPQYWVDNRTKNQKPLR